MAESERTAAPESAGDSLPLQFGKYTLLRKLAAGGMAEIFLALHRSVAGFEKLVVIKRIRPSMNSDQGFIDMLLHEARIAATLSHPNIVQIFDVGQIEGTYFIAMEHIHGEDIRSIVQAMKANGVTEFPLEHTLEILLGVCAGLAYAHDKRDLDGRLLDIVHRDISPQNIVVTFTGDVKIVDFGIAKSGVQTGETTKDGQLKGKVPYMSPEQASGGDVDWRSDIFAAGVLLFELTTGKRLFKGASEFETLKLICEREYPLPSEVRPGYPLGLERIVMRALEKKREDRYASAREMQQDLETFAREERIAVSQVALTKWMQGLFVAKLARHKEALQDIKQLADVIAAQQSSLYEGSNPSSTTHTTTPAAVASVRAPSMPKRRGGVSIAMGALALCGVGAAAFWALGPRGSGARAPEAESAAPSSPVVVDARGAISIKTKPDGCAIWVDGDLRSETTPATIDKLPLGREIDLKLTQEGLEPYRESITLTGAAPSKEVEVEMKTGSVTVLLKIEPSPVVWIDGKPWKGDREKLEGLSADEEHKVVVSASGYSPRTFSFTAKRGETKTFAEKLIKLDAASAAALAREEKSRSEAKPVAAGGGPAKVRVGARGGFCNVTINGTSYGPTPVEASVSSGTVRVSCKPDKGSTMSQAVSVQPGETARVSFKVDPQ